MIPKGEGCPNAAVAMIQKGEGCPNAAAMIQKGEGSPDAAVAMIQKGEGCPNAAVAPTFLAFLAAQVKKSQDSRPPNGKQIRYSRNLILSLRL